MAITKSHRFPQLGPMGEESETVAGVAQLYLGNILYALELAALSLDEQRKATDAAFYRGR